MLSLRSLVIFATTVLACGATEAPLSPATPRIDPALKAKEVARLEALPMATHEASAALGSTLGEVIETLALSANMSYVALPEGGLKDTPVTFRIYDTAYGALKTLSTTYRFEMVCEQNTSGRVFWRFTPIRPDELITRFYVLKNATHEITSSNGSAGGFSSSSQSQQVQQSAGAQRSGGEGGAGGNGAFSSSNPLVAQLEKFLAAGDSRSASASKGYIEWISDSNGFLVRATNDQHRDIEEFLMQIDQPVPQIQLDFAFVLATVSPTSNVGANLSIVENGLPITLSGLSTSVDLNHISATQAPSSALLSTSDVLLRLQAYAQNKDSFSVVTGSQTTLSNREAELNAVQELPIQQNTLATVGSTSSSVTTGTIDFKDVGTKVMAKVKALADGKVSLTLDISVSSVVDYSDVGGQKVPITAKQQYKSSVIIEDGLSLAMGGLESSLRTEIMKKIPVLGDIPFFGFPFKSISKDNTRTRLLLFVTPHIMTSYKGGEFAAKTKIAPVLSRVGRKVFDAKPGLSVMDVEVSLAGMSEEISGLELAVRSGRGDANVRRDADLLLNELDLMLVTVDENKLKGKESAEVRQRLKTFRGRVADVAKSATMPAL